MNIKKPLFVIVLLVLIFAFAPLSAAALPPLDPLIPPFPLLHIPLASGISADPTSLPKGGGTVTFTITGINLTEAESIGVMDADATISITDSSAQVTSDTEHQISMTLPANVSFMVKTYTFYPYIDGVKQNVTGAEVTVAPSLIVPPLLTLTTVSEFTANKTSLPASGGAVKFTLTGTNLDEATTLEVKGTGGFSADVDVDSATSGTATINIPANTSTAQKTYVFNPVVNGTAQTLSVTVTIAAPAAPSEGSMANFLQKNTYARGMFTDVDESKWYGFDGQKVIATVYEYGLMKGSGATTFNPLGNVTLAEAVAMAARVHKIYLTGDDTFIQGSPWYQVYIDYALANGIIQGGDFSDYTKVATRAQMAYIFANSLPITELTPQNTVNSLPDVGSGTPYQAAIIALYKAGVLSGSDAAGTFKPFDPISRAEAAAIISRIAIESLRLAGRTY